MTGNALFCEVIRIGTGRKNQEKLETETEREEKPGSSSLGDL